jgi:hypothetical protein
VVFHLPITANDVGKKDGVALLLNEIIFTYLNLTLPKYFYLWISLDCLREITCPTEIKFLRSHCCTCIVPSKFKFLKFNIANFLYQMTGV